MLKQRNKQKMTELLSSSWQRLVILANKIVDFVLVEDRNVKQDMKQGGKKLIFFHVSSLFR